jgi:acetate---CoA ligase (ADP-forming) subunit beta
MTHTLSEAESKRVLAAYGIPVLEERTATTPDGAVEAADALGYPVVVKLCGPGIAHKTERGLLRLALADAVSVRRAGTELLAAAVPSDGASELLVAPMVRGARELIAGVHVDRQFGPCAMVGVGGIMAEAVGDVAFRLVPLERVDAEEMLDDLATGAVLGEFRGEPAADRDAVAEVLLGLSRLAQHEPALVSVDINPMILVDGKPVAVDALVEVERS